MVTHVPLRPLDHAQHSGDHYAAVRCHISLAVRYGQTVEGLCLRGSRHHCDRAIHLDGDGGHECQAIRAAGADGRKEGGCYEYT